MSHPINPPIYWSSIFMFDTSEDLIQAAAQARRRFVDGETASDLYTRWDNPTVRYLEQSLATLEHAEEALAFGSGMAAIATACMAFVTSGDCIVTSPALYGGTTEFFGSFLSRFGVEALAMEKDFSKAQALIAERKPRIVYIESPTNPTLEIFPLRELASLAHEHGALAFIDNTFATPALQNPLDYGFDLVIHSATKALGGHHDVMGGLVAGKRPIVDPIWQTRKLLGGILDPLAAYMIYRGMQTLEVRMTRQSETALGLARFLETHPCVEQVHYPGLENDPGYPIASVQMKKPGSMLSFLYRGTGKETAAMIDRLHHFHRAGSLGGVTSLVTQPATTSHLHVPPETRRRLGITDNLVRLSIGLEPLNVLVDDLNQAMRL